MPRTTYEDVQHSQAILAAILDHLWGHPTQASSLIILEGTDSSSNFWEGGHLVRWRVLGSDMLLSMHLFEHRMLYRPMATQELLEVLLSDGCLSIDICCVAAMRPAQLPGRQGLHRVKLISEAKLLKAACTLFAANSASSANALALQYARLSALTDFLHSFNACLYFFL